MRAFSWHPWIPGAHKYNSVSSLFKCAIVVMDFFRKVVLKCMDECVCVGRNRKKIRKRSGWNRFSSLWRKSSFHNHDIAWQKNSSSLSQHTPNTLFSSCTSILYVLCLCALAHNNLYAPAWLSTFSFLWLCSSIHVSTLSQSSFLCIFCLQDFFPRGLDITQNGDEDYGSSAKEKSFVVNSAQGKFHLFCHRRLTGQTNTQNKNRKRGETLRNSWQESRQQHRNSGLYKQGPKHKERNGYSRTTAKQDSCCAQ